jgi:uncharacterized protein (TIGR03083 family)
MNETAADAWAMVDAERTELADLADTLTAEQWDAPSLCAGWKVRDVVAHVIQGATVGTGESIKQLVKYGFRINKLLNEEALKGGAEPTDQLRTELRATIGSRVKQPGVKPPGMVFETVVHQQDVRRPLGKRRQIPADRLRVALDDATRYNNTLLPTKKRLKGLHLKATDLDWETGAADGAEVTGPGEALLMAAVGRPDALADLSGPGVDTLREHIGG